jgi:hypothetical protein
MVLGVDGVGLIMAVGVIGKTTLVMVGIMDGWAK